MLYESGVEGLTVPDRTGWMQLALAASVVYWWAQSAALAVSVADLVATPMGYGLARTLVGRIELLALGRFATLLGLGLPRLMRTAAKLVR